MMRRGDVRWASAPGFSLTPGLSDGIGGKGNEVEVVEGWRINWVIEILDPKEERRCSLT